MSADDRDPSAATDGGDPGPVAPSAGDAPSPRDDIDSAAEAAASPAPPADPSTSEEGVPAHGVHAASSTHGAHAGPAPHGAHVAPVDTPAAPTADNPYVTIHRPPAADGTPSYPGTADTAAAPLYIPPPPAPPVVRSNRGVGALLALLGGVVFALVYAAVALVILGLTVAAADWISTELHFVTSVEYWLPVGMFTVALVLIVLIVNTATWWAYVLGGFFVAILTYLAAIAGGLIGLHAWTYSPQDIRAIAGTIAVHPLILATAVVGREVPVWIGAWIGRRGRRITAQNRAAVVAYDRAVSETPTASHEAPAS